MTGSRPRLVIAVLSGVMIVLAALGALILTSGGGTQASDALLGYTPAPQVVSSGAAVAPAGNGASRSSTRRALAPRGVDPAWAARTGAAAGIPATAVAAYGSTELRLRREQPGCHLSWNTLAGIGWIESQHGTIGGRRLLADGRSSTPVIGPALDGRGFAAIRATPESTAWHGDPTWDHAVGPLQFLSSTWDRWGADGDRDGVADPRDLDDAAYTAGRYLCADGHDLATVAGWNAAVHSYNHSDGYVLSVYDAANSYAERTR